MVWCGVVKSGVVWCGEVWCGVVVLNRCTILQSHSKRQVTVTRFVLKGLHQDQTEE